MLYEMLFTITISLYTSSFSWKALALPHRRKAFQRIRMQVAHIQNSLSINLNLWTHITGESRDQASFRLSLFQQLTVPPDLCFFLEGSFTDRMTSLEVVRWLPTAPDSMLPSSPTGEETGCLPHLTQPKSRDLL